MEWLGRVEVERKNQQLPTATTQWARGRGNPAEGGSARERQQPLLSCVREQGGVSERPAIERAGQLSAPSSKFEGERERAKFQFPVFPTSTFNG